jgi:hypothetical protein
VICWVQGNQQGGFQVKTRLFKLFALLTLMGALIPASSAFASAKEDFNFYGTIQNLPNAPGWTGDWVVSGRTVHVTGATQIDQEHGAVALGGTAKVEGYQLPDEWVNAYSIEVRSSGGGGGGKEGELYGPIQQLPKTPGYVGNWMVNGHTVHVSAATHIKLDHRRPSVAFAQSEPLLMNQLQFCMAKVSSKGS